MQTANKKLTTFLKNNPGTTKEQIGAQLKINGLALFNLLKSHVKEGVITIIGEGNDATYSLAETTNAGTTSEQQTIIEETPIVETNPDKEGATSAIKEEVPPVVTQPVAKKVTSRDNSTFKFEGADLNKGALARAIISKFVADQNPNYSQLKVAFPDTLLKKYGVVQDEKTAREISGEKYDRYFFKTEYAIMLKDKKTVVVCNQWTLDNIQPLIKVAKELGYKIK